MPRSIKLLALTALLLCSIAAVACTNRRGPDLAIGQKATLQYRDKTELPLSLALDQVASATASLENGDGNELNEMTQRGTINLVKAGTQVTVLRLEEVAGTRVFFVQADATETKEPAGLRPGRHFMSRPQGYVPARWLRPVTP